MLRYALALSLLVLPAAAGAQDLKLVEPGKLTWAVSATFVPFEFMKDGRPVGFDVDLVDAIAKQAKLTSNIMGMEFKGIIPALLGSRVDIAVSGIYVTPERQQVADFVPYMVVGNQLVTPKGNPKHVTDKMSLCGLKVAVPVSTAFEAAAKKVSEECKAAGKPELDLLCSNVVGLALMQGRADAALNSTATIAAMIGENPDAYELAGAPFDANTKLGIALRKDDVALKAALDTALQAVVKDGTYAALLKKWNLPASASIF
jgi:polar amino acid transport system substrate-binding protein